ncbi:MAG: penicillin-binding protein [Saprospiraceae bacterium]|nr:penicillin-binding protein [Saprospiraceae bacterium]
MSKHNELLFRVYFTMVMVVLCALLLSFKAVKINVIEGERWSAKGDSLYLKYMPVRAERGNILDVQGRLLATSLPIFEIRMDLRADGLTDEVFKSGIDSLAWCLSRYVNPSWSERRYRDHLIKRRNRGDRYLLIARNINYAQLERIKRFPIFRLGPNKGGFIIERQNKRSTPYGILAARTIGYVRPNVQPVGLEGYFNDQLRGEDGKRLMQRISTRGTWIPVRNLGQIDAKRGADIVTTIDVDIQDLAESALYDAVYQHNAQWGVAIVMDVKTGAIRAIANLEPDNGRLIEKYNYAVGAATEPGSTMKLASMMAMLEDDLVTLDTKVDITNGYARFYNADMYDTGNYGDTVDLRTAFEKSSNVGIAKTVQRVYGEPRQADKFIARLRQFGLDRTTGVEIPGEAAPHIKEAYNTEQSWSGISLPWMSTGYEVQMTPLQMLTFYNAVANNGRMMRPYLASAVVQDGRTVKSFKPKVAISQIASRETITKAQELLAGVVLRGTAKAHRSEYVSFAGKTGTAVIEYFKNSSDRKKYQGSFAGYFPADDPQYSCLVMIYNPRGSEYYGSDVALPAFVEIAEGVMALSPRKSSIDGSRNKPDSNLPPVKFAYKTDIQEIGNALDVRFDEIADSEWVALENPQRNALTARNMEDMRLPDLRGMGLRDAVFLLENAGLEVSTSGAGRVIRQSVRAGTQVSKGTRVQLVLG